MSGNSGMLFFLEYLVVFFLNLLNMCMILNWVVVFVYYFNLLMVYFNLKNFFYCFYVIDELFV